MNNTEETYKQLSRFVNNFNSDNEGFVKEFMKDHRTLQQSAGRLFIQCLEAMAELEDHEVDARNEALRDASKEMIDYYKEEHGYKPSEGLPTI